MLKHLFLRPEMLGRLIFSKPDGQSYYVQATSEQKTRRALPEEIVRQLFVLSLLHDYKYPEGLIRLELPIQMGREKKRADIAVLEANGNVKIIIEVKVEHDKDSMPQLMSYMAITGALYGAIVSSAEIICVKRLSTQDIVPISDLPIFLGNDTLSEPEIQAKHNPQPSFPGTPCASIEVEGFERNTPTHAKITIKGHTLQLSNVELESYKKLRQKFLIAGVALNPNVKQAEWFDMFSQLLETTPINAMPILVESDTSSEPEIQTDYNPQPSLPGTPCASIEVEGFERNTPTHAKITIKGHTLQLSNVELESYKKLRQKFLIAGAALNPNVKQAEWFEIFSQLLEHTPITYLSSPQRGSAVDEKALAAIEEALGQGQPGFSGGWISSFALDRLLDRLKISVPRTNRKKLLNALGYEWHPNLPDGRLNNPINDPSGDFGRPRLFISKEHMTARWVNGSDIARAYLADQVSGS